MASCFLHSAETSILCANIEMERALCLQQIHGYEQEFRPRLSAVVEN
jgi:hypothetical protein